MLGACSYMLYEPCACLIPTFSMPIDLFRTKSLQTPLKYDVASGNLFHGQPRRRGSCRRSSVLAAWRLLQNQQPVEPRQLEAPLLPMRRMPTGGRRIDYTAFLDTRNRPLYASERREVSVRAKGEQCSN